MSYLILIIYILMIKLKTGESIIDKTSVIQNEEMEKKITMDDLDFVLGESLFETELDFIEEEHVLEYEEEHEEEHRFAEETEETLDYQDIQMQIILDDAENSRMWEDYKRYVDEAILIGLQDATLCR